MKEIPLGYVEMRQAFGPDGEYGAWLRQHSAMVMINGVAFVHGGVDLETAALGCDGVNAGVQAGRQRPSTRRPNRSWRCSRSRKRGRCGIAGSCRARRRPTSARF